jgi:hypothetical protein
MENNKEREIGSKEDLEESYLDPSFELTFSEHVKGGNKIELSFKNLIWVFKTASLSFTEERANKVLLKNICENSIVPYYIYNNECGINRFYYPEYMFKDNE